MAFLLTIIQGAEKGKSLGFEQADVTIGRTLECDILLYDPGVSRQHARIRWEAEGYVVEDLGSANGTKINGTRVKTQLLNDGDSIGVGPVIFQFMLEERTQIGHPELPSIDDESTRIVASGEVRRPSFLPLDAPTPVPEEPSVDDDEKTNVRPRPEPMAEDESPTDERPLLGALSDVAGEDLDDKTSIRLPPERPAPSALDRVRPRSGEKAGTLARADPGSSGVRANGSPKASALSAADRARIRREASGMDARVRIFWLDATPARRRLAVVAVAVAALMAVLITVSQTLGVGSRTRLGPEPQLLKREPVRQSFGLGAGVDFVHADKKRFEFEFNSPVRAVVILHYQAKDISEGELTMAVNGALLPAAVPPDTLNSEERRLEQLVPFNLLKKGVPNSVLFSNTRNPPRADTWRIFNLWVETVPLPELPLDQLVREAEEAYNRGLAAMRGKDIDKRNRFKAWKEFRTAWLFLEAHPDPKPEQYRLAMDHMRVAQTELDTQCAKLLLEAERDVIQKDFVSANAALNEVKEWFPTYEQPCSEEADRRRGLAGL